MGRAPSTLPSPPSRRHAGRRPPPPPPPIVCALPPAKPLAHSCLPRVLGLVLCSLAIFSFATEGDPTQSILTVMLTAVAYSVVIAEDIPKLGYLTFLDKCEYGAFSLAGQPDVQAMRSRHAHLSGYLLHVLSCH